MKTETEFDDVLPSYELAEVAIETFRNQIKQMAETMNIRLVRGSLDVSVKYWTGYGEKVWIDEMERPVL